MPLRVAGHAGPQASARAPVPGEVGVTHGRPTRRDQPGITKLVFSRMPGHGRGDISRV